MENEEMKISTIGLNCPKPLIETRKALNKMKSGQILIVEGDHKVSLKEIPQAIKDSGDEVLEIEEKDERWIIKIKKV